MSTTATPGLSGFLLAQKRSSPRRAAGAADSRLLNLPNAESDWFDLYPAEFPVYPLPGTGPIDVLAFTVPQGADGVIQKLAIVNLGGGLVDGTGQVVWRVLVNGAAVRGYQQATSQVGSYAQPMDTFIPIYEADLVEVTVEVPAGQQPLPVGSTTAARCMGYFFPKQRQQQQ